MHCDGTVKADVILHKATQTWSLCSIPFIIPSLPTLLVFGLTWEDQEMQINGEYKFLSYYFASIDSAKYGKV